MPINDLLPQAADGDRWQTAASPDATRPVSWAIEETDKKQIMRLSKIEWMWVAVAAGSIACFGSWLQGEMNRTALARAERATQDMRGTCSGMSAHEAQMMAKGELWCGEVGAARTESLGKE